jgi:hypothetical protein
LDWLQLAVIRVFAALIIVDAEGSIIRFMAPKWGQTWIDHFERVLRMTGAFLIILWSV